MSEELAFRRRSNLRQVIKDRGGATAVAQLLGHANAAFLSQMAGPNPSRAVTEKTARLVEEKLGLEAGLLDREVVETSSPGMLALDESLSVLVEGLNEEHIKAVPSEKFATVCMLLFEQYQREGHVALDYVQRLALLLR